MLQMCSGCDQRLNDKNSSNQKCRGMSEVYATVNAVQLELYGSLNPMFYPAGGAKLLFKC